MKRFPFLLTFLAFLLPLLTAAQDANGIKDPVTWTSEMKMTSSDKGEIILTCHIDKGYHIYGMETVEGAGIPTTITFGDSKGLKLIGNPEPSSKPIEKFDKVYQLDLKYWENQVSFTQKFQLEEGSYAAAIVGKVHYMCCSDVSCLRPTDYDFNLSVAVEGHAEELENAKASLQLSVEQDQPQATTTLTDNQNAGWWEPVKIETEETESSWWHILLWGFLGGLLALLTPCVWPMIPMTVSFFLKRTSSRRKSIIDASIYGLAIIVIYLAMGLAVTAIFGASKLNELATNAVFNIIFFLLLVVFAISFFGAFDIKLPAKWSNSMDSKAERTTGLISIFFMAFTLVLVSFSCTGPLIGTLLVEAASQGDYLGPALGMAAFAIALAIPFALFAIFPSMLKELPKSGGWLNSVKVVLGFLELILSLKFLSVVDLAYGWGILDREVFVSLWIILFILLGAYLLGKIRFSHDAPLEYVSIPRFFMALISLSFAVYLLPGMWGAPLKAVSAFVPPLYTQDFNLYNSGEIKHFNDYEEGMAYAAENNLPVLMDFTGYACVNCRKMEGAVFDTPEVKEIIDKNFVMITLYVDEKADLEKPIVVKENGKDITLRTVGDKWSYLQRYKFGANAQPYYIILDNQGNAMSTSYSYDEDVEKFLNWLNGGLSKYRSQGN